MAGNKEWNADLELKGKAIIYTVPNGTGTILTYNPTTKEISQRTNNEIISDLSLATQSFVTSQGYITNAALSGYATENWVINNVWHAGNDGSNSGLDADLLDGLHSSSFLVKAYNSATQGNNIDWNTLTYPDNSIYFQAYHTNNYTGQTNEPNLSGYGTVLTLPMALTQTIFGHQIALDNVGNLAIRGEYNSNSFTSNWVKYWNSNQFTQANIDTWNNIVNYYNSGLIHKVNPNGGLYNASDSHTNKTWFDYNWAGTGYAGSVINFSGLDGRYNTEIFGEYLNGGSRLGFRTKNGNTNTWNLHNWIWHSGNLPDYRNYGLGKFDLNAQYNINESRETGFYSIYPGLTSGDAPFGYGSLIHMSFAGTTEFAQIGVQVGADRLVYRTRRGDGSLGSWVTVWDNVNFNPNYYQTAGNYVTLDTSQTIIADKNFAQTSDVTFYGNESNEVKVWRSTVNGLGSVVSGHILNWYSTRWKVGNIRGGASDSLGYGFWFSSDDGTNYSEKLRITTDSNIITQSFGSADLWNQAYNWGNHANAGYTTQSWVNNNFISNTHVVNSITQSNINNWNNIAQYGIRLNTPLNSNSAVGLYNNYFALESGLVDVQDNMSIATKQGEYYKYGSYIYNGFHGINYKWTTQQVSIGKEISTNEDKLEVGGNISVPEATSGKQLIVNPLFNEDGDVRESRHAHIYIETTNHVYLPNEPILGQRFEIYNISNSPISVIHNNIGVLFNIPAQYRATGIVSSRGFRFELSRTNHQEYII